MNKYMTCNDCNGIKKEERQETCFRCWTAKMESLKPAHLIGRRKRNLYKCSCGVIVATKLETKGEVIL